MHPLPGLILEWRRITNALTKVVFPLQREKKYHSALAMDRIYPVSQTHTATGTPAQAESRREAQSDPVSFSHQAE